jgi:hypothetical protein
MVRSNYPDAERLKSVLQRISTDLDFAAQIFSATANPLGHIFRCVALLAHPAGVLLLIIMHWHHACIPFIASFNIDHCMVSG